jgi:hypothetical protein
MTLLSVGMVEETASFEVLIHRSLLSCAVACRLSNKKIRVNIGAPMQFNFMALCVLSYTGDLKIAPYYEICKDFLNHLLNIYLCMKNFLILMSCLTIIACQARHKAMAEKTTDDVIIPCPDDGVCALEVLQGKSLEWLEDPFGNRYPEISDGSAVVLKFEYKRHEIPNTADSDYRELIFMELPADKPAMSLKDGELVKAKVLFARLCFCRGQTGYYPVTKGSLSITEINNKYQLSLDFKVDEVPQVINAIKESFVLN